MKAPEPAEVRMLSSLLLPILRERFPGRGLVEGAPPDPCAVFPGVHPGIRGVSIYDDGHELTVCVDDLTHGHFAEYDDAVPEGSGSGGSWSQSSSSWTPCSPTKWRCGVSTTSGAGGIASTWAVRAVAPASPSTCGRGRGHKGRPNPPAPLIYSPVRGQNKVDDG